VLDVIEQRDISGHPAPTAAAAPLPAVAAPAPAEATAQPSAGPARVDGDWSMVLATPMGPQAMAGHFATQGAALSGYLESPEGRQDFTGTVDGGRVKFDLKVDKPMKMTLKYDLVVDGDAITGKVKLGMFGTAKLSGERID
jgi:carbon-monoxide dehydrogenase large subunit